MLMQVARDPNGTTQTPLQVLRTAPGGPDQGQTDRSVTGSVDITGGKTIPLWTVGAGKTIYVIDIELYLSANSGAFQLCVDGQPVWQGLAGSTLPLIRSLAWPKPAGPGKAVTLVCPNIAATLTFNLGAWEQ